MSLSHRIGRLEAAARRALIVDRKPAPRVIASVWLQPAWDALSDAERAAEKIVVILPDNGREAVHHVA